MGVSLTEARTATTTSALHIGSSSLSNAKVDRALLRAGHEFLRSTDALRLASTHTVAANATSFNPQTGLSGFVEDRFVRAYIASPLSQLQKVDDEAMLDRLDERAVTRGTPTLISFESQAVARVWPSPKAAVTVTLITRDVCLPVAFSPGDSATGITYNLPNEWVYDVIGLGARYYLLAGAPGHPDAAQAGADWKDKLAEARLHFGTTRTGLQDADAPPRQSA